MAGTQPRRPFAARLGSSAVRGVNAAAPGARRVRRSTDSQSDGGWDGDWVVVEPEADIAAKGHPYISFDPAGTYP